VPAVIPTKEGHIIPKKEGNVIGLMGSGQAADSKKPVLRRYHKKGKRVALFHDFGFMGLSKRFGIGIRARDDLPGGDAILQYRDATLRTL
jgi:hypothetical protein